MRQLTDIVSKLKIRQDTMGQDIMEFALMAGFVAVSIGVFMPDVSGAISGVLVKVTSVLAVAAGGVAGPGGS